MYDLITRYMYDLMCLNTTSHIVLRRAWCEPTFRFLSPCESCYVQIMHPVVVIIMSMLTDHQINTLNTSSLSQCCGIQRWLTSMPDSLGLFITCSQSLVLARTMSLAWLLVDIPRLSVCCEGRRKDGSLRQALLHAQRTSLLK